MYLLDTNILIDISRRKLNAAYEPVSYTHLTLPTN